MVEINISSTIVPVNGAIAQILSRKQEEDSIEAVIILPASGQVKVLNEVGARIWQLLDGNNQVGDVVDVILQEYAIEAVQARHDVFEFLEDLMRRGVVRIKTS